LQQFCVIVILSSSYVRVPSRDTGRVLKQALVKMNHRTRKLIAAESMWCWKMKIFLH